MRVSAGLLPLAMAASFAIGCGSEPAPASSAPAATTSAVPAQTLPAPEATAPGGLGPAQAWIGPLPPMPFADYPAGRPPETIKAVYEYAARNPEVLHYVPCFCGCEREGHRNNDDCFVASREPNGRPVWEPHGAT